MKFAKPYINHIKEKQPEWSDKFLSYNELKRLIRLIPDGNAEADFMCLLNNEIDKFNDFFIEKEEEYIIQHKVNTLSSTRLYITLKYLVFYFYFVIL